MSKNLFIADLHYGHNKISEKFRDRFSSDEEHNMTIHENILSASGKRNHLWILGDIVFKTDHFGLIKDYVEYYDSVHLVLGNHDHKAFPAYASKIGAKVYGLVQKYNLWLSHCPIHPQEMYRCKANIHGHLHTNKVAALPKMEGQVMLWGEDPRYLCVSCEQIDYKPISLETIREILGGRGIEV